MSGIVEERAALEWLRARGHPAGGSDFKSEVNPAHSVTGQSGDTWWRKTVRPALDEAGELGLVERRPVIGITGGSEVNDRRP